MFSKKNWVILLGTALVLLALIGCSTATSVGVPIESGTIADDYVGVVNPVVEKELKLTEEEKKYGVRKVTIKCGVKIDIPSPDTDEENKDESETEESSTDSGGDDRAKPKI